MHYVAQKYQIVLASKPVGKLYHFLGAERLALVLGSNRLVPHGGSTPLDLPKKLLHYVNDSGDKVFWGISTTRNPIWKPNEAGIGYWGPIRITLDGTKLSTKYKIISYNDFWKFDDVSRKLKDAFYNQAEEKIVTTKKGIGNFLQYVVDVEVLEKERDLFDEGFKNNFEGYGLGQKLTQAGIPWRYVKKFSSSLRKGA